MSIKEQVHIEVLGKMIKVTLHAAGDNLKALNAFVEFRIRFLQDADAIKWYSNKVDFFAVMPQDGWQPVEVMIELKKLLNL